MQDRFTHWCEICASPLQLPTIWSISIVLNYLMPLSVDLLKLLLQLINVNVHGDPGHQKKAAPLMFSYLCNEGVFGHHTRTFSQVGSTILKDLGSSVPRAIFLKLVQPFMLTWLAI